MAKADRGLREASKAAVGNEPAVRKDKAVRKAEARELKDAAIERRSGGGVGADGDGAGVGGRRAVGKVGRGGRGGDGEGRGGRDLGVEGRGGDGVVGAVEGVGGVVGRGGGRLAVEVVGIGEIRPDPANPRKHGERNLEEIAASLRDHGQVEPLVVQAGTMRLIAGHGRLEGMKRLGWKTAEVVKLAVDDMEAVRLGIRLNRTGELAEWDGDVLKSLLEMPDLGSVGFSQAEVDELLGAGAGKDVEGHGSGEGESIGEKYEVVVECGDEGEQRRVFERLSGEGLSCRVLTI